MADPKIKIKRSSVEGRIPTPDQVPLGEIALNTYDGYLYASKNVGIGTTVIAINPFRVGTGTDSYDAYFTAGNVGIGLTLPTEKLDVDGTVKATSFSGSGTNLTGIVTSITAGSGISVDQSTGNVTITAAGGGSDITVQDEGSNIGTAATTFNFVGSGVTATYSDGIATVTISGGATKTINTYTATESQTSFSATYSVGYVDVFLNGVKLSSSQFTATDGTSIVLSEGASVDDIVEIVGFTVTISGTSSIGGDFNELDAALFS